MATMNDCLFSKNKQNSAVNGISDNGDGQYSNLNLNQNYKCPNTIPVHFYSKTNKDKYHGKRKLLQFSKTLNQAALIILLNSDRVTQHTFKLPDFTVSENHTGKETLKAWNKSSDLCLNTLKFDVEVKEKAEKQWKRDNSFSNNSKSTLSLHIAAFEHSAAASFDSVAIKCESKKEIFTASTFVTQNPFEIPRQQNGKATEPEVSQYRASQRLFNPNQANREMYRHPIPKSYGGGRIMKKMPGGHSVFYPYEAPPADVEVKEYSIATSNFEFFHGYNNMFTLQFWTDISIDDIVYKSVDHYYQKMKVFDLTGTTTDKFDDPKIKNYSGVAREILRENNISRKTVDDWRTSCGVEVIQKALLEKVKQSTAFRDHLLATTDKIICHPFPLDDFFGTGCPVKYVLDWATSMQQKDAKLKFPISFPLTSKTAKNVPSVAKGRNMLGAIYIALREQIKAGNLNDLTVSLTPVDQTVKIKKTAPRLPTATMTRLLPPTNQISSPNTVPLNSANAVPLRDVLAPTAAAPNSNGYAGYTAGQPPMMYTAEQQRQYQNNRPSIVAQLPEVPVAPDLRYFNNPSGQFAPPQQNQGQYNQPPQYQGRPGPPQQQNQVRAAPTTDQMYANYQSQQAQYQQQQQQQAQQRRPATYASLAAQNQDFSMDVDNISGPIANTQVTRQVFQPAGAGNQSMYQGSYDWQW